MSALAFLSPTPALGSGQFTRPARPALSPRPKRAPRPSARRAAPPPQCCVEMPAWKRTMPVDPDFAKNEQLQILEADLERAVATEDYAHASHVHDRLTRLQSGAFVAVMSANLKFYNAVNSRSIVDIAGCWMQRGDVTVKFPFGPLIDGYLDVINAFGQLFSMEYNPVEVRGCRIIMRGSVGYVTCEEVVVLDDGTTLRSHATNIFEKRNGQWYIVHYSSVLMNATA